MGHFPKKGERKVNGEWVIPAPEKPARPVETATDRRNFFKRKAGWPVKGES